MSSGHSIHAFCCCLNRDFLVGVGIAQWIGNVESRLDGKVLARAGMDVEVDECADVKKMCGWTKSVLPVTELSSSLADDGRGKWPEVVSRTRGCLWLGGVDQGPWRHHAA